MPNGHQNIIIPELLLQKFQSVHDHDLLVQMRAIMDMNQKTLEDHETRIRKNFRMIVAILIVLAGSGITVGTILAR